MATLENGHLELNVLKIYIVTLTYKDSAKYTEKYKVAEVHI